MPSSLCLCPRKPPPSPLFSPTTPIREVLCKERTEHAREIVFWCMKSCYECTLLPYFHSFTAQDTSTLKRGRRRHETKHGNTHPPIHPPTHHTNNNAQQFCMVHIVCIFSSSKQGGGGKERVMSGTGKYLFDYPLWYVIHIASLSHGHTCHI